MEHIRDIPTPAPIGHQGVYCQYRWRDLRYFDVDFCGVLKQTFVEIPLLHLLWDMKGTSRALSNGTPRGHCQWDISGIPSMGHERDTGAA